MNDKIKQDNDTRLQDNETCVTEHIPQVTLRLTIDYSKFQKFPLDQWYAKAKKYLEQTLGKRSFITLTFSSLFMKRNPKNLNMCDRMARIYLKANL